MKKSYILAVLVFLCAVFAGCGNKVEYTYKTINKDTEVMILGITDTEGVTDLEIPAEIGGLPVTTIEMGAFADFEELKSVKLPSTLETIGVASFGNCISLTNVEFKEGLKEISEHAFSGCIRLGSPEFPEGLEKIGNYAFNGCAAIRRLKLPESVTEVGSYAFKGCTSLKSIETMGSIEELFAGTFMDCTALENINYPEMLKAIYEQVFSGCTSIKTLTDFPEKLGVIGKAFENCTGLTAVEIPAGVHNISYEAFAGSLNIQTIKVSDNNKYYTSKDINGNEMNVLICMSDRWQLYDVGLSMPIPDGVDFAIPEGVEGVYKHALDTCKDATSILLPESFGWASTLGVFTELPNVTSIHGKAGSPVEKAVEMISGKTFVVTE